MKRDANGLQGLITKLDFYVSGPLRLFGRLAWFGRLAHQYAEYSEMSAGSGFVGSASLVVAEMDILKGLEVGNALVESGDF